MSIKYNRFLVTTCLPVMAIAIFSSPASYAGFEWTPPVKVEPIEVTPEPVTQEEIFDPVTVPVVEEVTPEIKDQGLAPIDIKVIEDKAEEKPVEILEIKSDEASQEVEAIIEESPFVSEEPVMDSAEEIVVVEEPPVVLEDVDAQTATPNPVNANSLEINPFPVEDMSPVEQEKAIVLPTDEDMGLDDISSDDVIEKSAVTAEENKTEEIFWNKPPSFDIIEGFGSDMPLALALSQIVPPHYAYSFGEGVNPGAIISWDGGLPWNEVLKNALEPAGYQYSINGKKLSITTVKKTDLLEPTTLLETQEPTELKEETSVDQVLEDVIDIEENSAAFEEPAILEEVPAASMDAEVHEQNEAVSEPAEIIEVAEENVEDDPIIEATDEGGDIIDVLPEETSVKRGSIVDPGQTEATQPEADMLSDEKKNIETIETKFDQKHVADEQALHTSELLAFETEATDIKNNIEGVVPTPHHEQEELTVIEIPTLDEEAEIKELTENVVSFTDEDSLIEEQVIEDIEAEIPSNTKLKDVVSSEIIIEDNIASTPLGVASTPEEIVAEAPKAEPSNSIIVWEGKKGHSLQSILKKWCATENIELIWGDSVNDIDLSSNIFVNGTFKNAIDVLLTKGVSKSPSYEISTEPYQLHIK
ncbi:MAG: hypothetical protein ACRBDI_06405 [Alphaproteobacteria bacterium]